MLLLFHVTDESQLDRLQTGVYWADDTPKPSLPVVRDADRSCTRDRVLSDRTVTRAQRLVVRGARANNLRDVSLELPLDALVVVTGLSGSGKSSLAFDTIFAEGQRRYMESLSAYARRSLDQVDRPDVDEIVGLPPAVSIDQHAWSDSRRSTVGTISELANHVRLLFSRLGRPHCPECCEPLAYDPLIARWVCAGDRTSVEPPAARSFSFNSPYGACPACTGLGVTLEVDLDSVVPDPTKSLAKGAVAPWSFGGRMKQLAALRAIGVDLDTPWRDLPPEHRELILRGDDVPVRARHESSGGSVYDFNTSFVNVERSVKRSYAESESEAGRQRLERFLQEVRCTACGGSRLRRESLLVTIDGRSIVDHLALTLDEYAASLDGVEDALAGEAREISRRLVRELLVRLRVLLDLGLGYLTLDRPGPSLSGGEAQRLKLATQMVSGVVNVLYVLDEPSIGLHPRDTERLLGVLVRLREAGNSLLVVEHDEATIRAADWVVELGPGAGEEGGEVVAAGTVAELEASAGTLTGDWLSGRRAIAVPSRRRPAQGVLRIVGARANNLAGVDVDLPLGVLVAVTGVSGSGKSTLVGDLLYPALAAALGGAVRDPGGYERLEGVELVDKVLHVDQSPIGRTPRSNPATYTGVFDGIRKLFAAVPLARERGYDGGRFSFNVKGGRCEACDGAGTITLDMQFLADAHFTCDACDGLRYEPLTLQVRYRGHSIADVLALQVRDALELFADVPAVRRPLRTLADVGLGYLRLGQPAPTLSGGEAQRVKLATELQRRSTGRTVYLLDEPTIGLHPADVQQLLAVLDRLVEAGNTVIAIEHDLGLVKCADWVVDLGPEGGPGGGEIVAAGTPEQVAAVAASHTGRALASVLSAG